MIAALKFLAGYPEPWPASGLVGAHRLAEAMKHVFAMRSHLGDPGYRGRAFEYSPTDEVAEVVRAMLSDDYIAGLQSATNDGGTMDIESYGGEWGLDRHVTDDSGTTGLIAVDKSGAVAAVTSTINTSFGSKLISKSTGILFNNEVRCSAASSLIPDTTPPLPFLSDPCHCDTEKSFQRQCRC